MKKLVVGIIIGAILTAASFAEVQEIFFNKVKIQVNGVPQSVENVLVNGRTYIQLRGLSSVFNKNVEWDGTTGTASINDKDYDPNSKNIGYSKVNPAELNQKVKITYEYGYTSGTLDPKKYTANITLKDIVRGDDANQIIKKGNMFYKDPDDGYDYMLAKIEFELLDAPDQYDLYNTKFNLISKDGQEYEDVYIVSAEPKLDAKLYKGAKNEGYAVFKVKITDSSPLLTFGRDYNGNGGAWFKAYK